MKLPCAVDASSQRVAPPGLSFDRTATLTLAPARLPPPPCSSPLRQVVNLVTNRVVKIIGKVENTERFLSIALYQARAAGGLAGRRLQLGCGRCRPAWRCLAGPAGAAARAALSRPPPHGAPAALPAAAGVVVLLGAPGLLLADPRLLPCPLPRPASPFASSPPSAPTPQGIPKRSKRLPAGPDAKLPQVLLGAEGRVCCCCRVRACARPSRSTAAAAAAPAPAANTLCPARFASLPPAQPDPTLLCCAFQKQRLFLFSQREPTESEDTAGGWGQHEAL